MPKFVYIYHYENGMPIVCEDIETMFEHYHAMLVELTDEVEAEELVACDRDYITRRLELRGYARTNEDNCFYRVPFVKS